MSPLIFLQKENYKSESVKMRTIGGNGLNRRERWSQLLGQSIHYMVSILNKYKSILTINIFNYSYIQS